jgi:hypothetical protein
VAICAVAKSGKTNEDFLGATATKTHILIRLLILFRKIRRKAFLSKLDEEE